MSGRRLPLILAHRANVNGPDPAAENTITAIRRAFAVPGLDGIELDVDLTRDGLLVLNHREEKEAPPTITLDSQELRARYPERPVPRLAEGLKTLRALLDQRLPGENFLINLEIKQDEEAAARYPGDYAARLLAEIRPHLKEREYILTSFAPELLRRLKQLQPGGRTGLILPGKGETPAMLAAVRRAAPDLLAPNASLLRRGAGTAEIIAPFREIYVWTVDRETEMKEFLREGRVTGIITNHPGLALALRGETS